MKFLLDGMVKGLLRWLRFLGWDARTVEDSGEQAGEEEEIVFVTRSRKHYLEWPGKHKILLKSDRLSEQLKELHARFGLLVPEKFLTRCSICNCQLIPLPRENARGRVPERVFQQIEEFYVCPGCGRIYWEGAHVRRMKEKLVRMGFPLPLNSDHISDEEAS